MVAALDIGFREALGLVLEGIAPMPVETVALVDALDRVGARQLVAEVNSPSVDAALKDGYAVISAEVATATAGRPVRLALRGVAAAGDHPGRERLAPGTTVRVLTGAALPEGADAVVAGEFASVDGHEVVFTHFAEPGRNVLARGSDVARGAVVVGAGCPLGPGRIGLLAAAGHHGLAVFRRPTVGILATGDEVVAPGEPLPEGKLYASNMAALGAWCRRFHWPTHLRIVRDDPDALLEALRLMVERADAVLTSGGAWTGDRDLVVRTLECLGWRRVFHRIRMGPGKAVGFGVLAGKPIFVLPGGPPSNWMAFLQIALPGLRKLAGWSRPDLPMAAARLAQTVRGRDPSWTQFITGVVGCHGADPLFQPLGHLSRLHSMAEANAILALPEGRAQIAAGEWVTVQLLS